MKKPDEKMAERLYQNVIIDLDTALDAMFAQIKTPLSKDTLHALVKIAYFGGLKQGYDMGFQNKQDYDMGFQDFGNG